MVQLRVWIVLFVLSLGGVSLAHQMHQEVDEARFAVDNHSQITFLPNGESIRVISMGYHGAVADIMWVRSILTFTELYEDQTDQNSLWLFSMLEAIAKLDPGWRTVYYFGGGMLRFFGNVDGSDRIFLLGMEALPLEPYFPFSVGMNAYLYHKDMDRAVKYMDIAASIPGAPPWYGAAAASFLDEGGQRFSAINYLQRQIEEATDPRVKQALTKKMKMLIYEDYTKQLNERRDAFIAENGRDIQALDELGDLPPDPYQAGWVISPEGEIRSLFVDQIEALKDVAFERKFLTRPFEDWDL